jgi:acetyl esterase/lipase
MAIRPGAVLLVGCVWLASAAAALSQPRIEWRLDSLERIGGHPVTIVGQPTVVDTDRGRAVSFDGVDDGLLIASNPLAGLSRFTIEVVFQPAATGPEEQRFVHFEESQAGNRALVELRMNNDGRWALDTFLRSPEPGLTLLNRALTHTPAEWHVARLSYDGRTMTHFVDGVREGHGDVAFTPLREGQTSLGMRQSRVSWFKGMIHTVRVIPEAARVIALWPDGVPGGRKGTEPEQIVDGRVSHVHSPSLTYIPPIGAPNGTAVVVCPGGSYARLAIANEGEGVAGRLSAVGVATFILSYRHADYGHPAPLQDVLRAIRLIRSQAQALGVRPDRIGVFGASAGGHVAASAATLYDTAEGRAGSALDAVSGRPDFVALLYPVITMHDPSAHTASRRNLLGDAPAAADLSRLSIESQVKADTPPVFLVHTTEDRSVPIENSLLLYKALRTAQVRVEMHLYERGEHGFGTRPGLGSSSGWVDRWFDWMRAHGWRSSSRPSRCLRNIVRPRRGRVASKDNGKPISATAPSSTRFSLAITPIRRF